MLVLSRKRNERILVHVPPGPARDVWFTVVEIRGDKARIGIEADPAVIVDREEVHVRKSIETAAPPDA